MSKRLQHFLQARRGTCAVAFCLTVFLALALLVASAFLPQAQIQQHILDSMDVIIQDLNDLTVADRGPASKLDTGTDAIILRAAMSTNSRYLGSVLTNPLYSYEGLSEWEHISDTIASQAYDMPHSSVFLYTRYWMGFRVLVRLALTFFTYGQLKRYMAFAFFVLFALVMASAARHCGSRLAFLFALSVILVRPHVIAMSMQFTCCFFIAFSAMLLVPWLYRHPRFEAVFFLEVGMITMYLDFYTVPLITFGLPMVYLCAIRGKQGKALSGISVLKGFFAWIAGYGLMWLAKLVLTTALTSVNSLSEGLQAFAGRVGLKQEQGLENFYSLKTLRDALEEVIFTDSTGIWMYALGALLVLAIVLNQLRKKRLSGACLRGGLPMLLLAAMPLVWFLAAAQPTAIHAYFQYRTITMTYWAVGGYLDFVLPPQPAPRPLIQQM